MLVKIQYFSINFFRKSFLIYLVFQEIYFPKLGFCVAIENKETIFILAFPRAFLGFVVFVK